MRAWLNGDLLDDPTIGAVAVTDHGFTVGDAVFEAVKTLAGEPFALTRHLARLERSAAGLGLPAPDLDAVRRGWRRSSARRPDRPAADHLQRRAGTHGLGARGRPADPGRRLQRHRAGRRVDDGDDGALDPQRERRDRGPQDHVVRRERHRAGPRSRARGTEAIFANTAGHLCEGTGSNVFDVVDGELGRRPWRPAAWPA